MKKVKSFEVVDDGYRVFIEWEDGMWSSKKIYHIGEEGILCNDLKTYIEFSEVEIGKSMVAEFFEKIKE